MARHLHAKRARVGGAFPHAAFTATGKTSGSTVSGDSRTPVTLTRSCWELTNAPSEHAERVLECSERNGVVYAQAIRSSDCRLRNEEGTSLVAGVRYALPSEAEVEVVENGSVVESIFLEAHDAPSAQDLQNDMSLQMFKSQFAQSASKEVLDQLEGHDESRR